MNRNKAYIVVLFVLGLVVSELHQLAPYIGNNSTVKWFIDVPDYPPTIHWYLKDVLLSFRDIIWMYGTYRMAKMIDYKLASVVTIFLVYCVLDMLLYFICYRMYGYGILYLLIGFFSFITILKRR